MYERVKRGRLTLGRSSRSSSATAQEATPLLLPGLPHEVQRPLSALLLLVLAAMMASLSHLAGWPREQVLMVGILAGTVLLWVTETLPLFATAFLSIALQLLLLGNPGGWSWLGGDPGNEQALEGVMNAAADPVLLLFFSGLILARAATKTGVDSQLAALVLSPMATTPAHLLLGVMLVTAFFSLWMSNTATTALMLALIIPILSQIPAAHPFRRALVLAIPISANVAGMSTPIASPPNALAMSYLTRAGIQVSFLEWMMIACPIVAILLGATWWWLLRRYPPALLQWQLVFPKTRLSGRGTWVVIVALTTFAIWVTEPWHGVPTPIAAALPIALFFATGVITREDVNSLDWDVLILIAGGLALGFGLQVAGLDQRLAAIVPIGVSDTTRLALLAFGTLALGTFFSNTAIASMLMPVAVIAATMAPEGLSLTSYAFTIAMVASMSMALPVSTPPNALAYASGALTTRDFIATGGFVGIVGAIVVVFVMGILLPLLGRQ